MSLFQLKKEQRIKASIGEIWDFISSPGNLKSITPDYMNFKIISSPEKKIYPGMIIEYHVKPMFGINTTWVTEITHVEDRKFFVDEQRIGPYKMWHHQHILEPIEYGVMMKDIISYKPPFGILGNLANKLIIDSKLNQIFDYRRKAIENIFGHYYLYQQ